MQFEKHWIYRLLELEYTAKGKHQRRSQCSGLESIANYGNFIKDTIESGSDLFLDGCGLSRSKVLTSFLRVGFAVHDKNIYVRKDTKNNNRLQRKGDNLAEHSFNEDAENKHIRKGCGPRCSGLENRQLWQYWMDWKHSCTDCSASDIVKTMMLHISVLWN